MKYDITLLVEVLALLGFICCILVLDANILLVGILISFVLCEIIMEWLQLKLKQLVSRLYITLYIIGTVVVSISSDGFHIVALFPAVFITALLIVSQVISSSNTNVSVRQSRSKGVIKKTRRLANH